MTARAAKAGALVVVAYLAAAAALLVGHSHPVRPLFEGIGPPPAYQWVNPPAQFAATNTKPGAGSTDVTITNGSSPASVIASPEGQFDLNLGQGAITSAAGDTRAHATVTPADPATLGALPAGLHPDGNAYRLALIAQPSTKPITKLGAGVSDIILQAPFAASTIVTSSDGITWQVLPSIAVGGPTTIGSTKVSQTGWFLAASSTATTPGPSASSSNTTVIVAAGAAGGAVVLGAVALIVRNRRRRPASGTGPRRGGPGTRPRGRPRGPRGPRGRTR